MNDVLTLNWKGTYKWEKLYLKCLEWALKGQCGIIQTDTKPNVPKAVKIYFINCST